MNNIILLITSIIKACFSSKFMVYQLERSKKSWKIREVFGSGHLQMPDGHRALICCFLCSSPVKKSGLLKTHLFEGDSFDSGSEGSESPGLCVSSLSALIGTVAETSEEKYRLLDQRDRIMRQGMVTASLQRSRDLVRSWKFVKIYCEVRTGCRKSVVCYHLCTNGGNCVCMYDPMRKHTCFMCA